MKREGSHNNIVNTTNNIITSNSNIDNNSDTSEQDKVDINQVFEEILLAEDHLVNRAKLQGEQEQQQLQQQQLQQDQQQQQQPVFQYTPRDIDLDSIPPQLHFTQQGYFQGAHLGAEIGYYMGVISACLTFSDEYQSPKVSKLILSIKEQVENFPSINQSDADFAESLTSIRKNFQYLSSLLKLKSFKYPTFNKTGMDFCKYLNNIKMNDEKISKLQHKLNILTSFLNKYTPLADCHMVEFITQDHWKTLVPKNIRSEIEQIGFDNAINVFWQTQDSNANIKCNHLVDFIEEASEISLDEDNDICYSINQSKIKLQEINCTDLPTHKINEFMSPKKSHEVEILSSLVASLTDWADCSHVVDIGGGRGYLSTMLCLLYHLPVLNVDCSTVNEKSAALRNIKLKRLWPGIAKQSDLSKVKLCSGNDLDHLYKHVTEYINVHSNLQLLINDNYNFDSENQNKDIKLCFTGLHTCGDLGSTLIHLFNKHNYARILCAVPCCYNLISESDNRLVYENSNIGFPMSSHLKDYTLSRNARMLASQSMDRAKSSKSLPNKSLFYRALIEVLFKDQAIINGRLKKVTGNCCDTFYDYVKSAANKLDFEKEFSQLDENYLNELEKQHDGFRKKLNIFYFIRISLASIIESIILLDRMLFLAENGYGGSIGDSFIIKMFDPVISPRCYCLVAYKK